MRWILGFLLGLSVFVTVKAVTDKPWFNHGTAPLQVFVHDPTEISAESCKSCHMKEFEDWQKSRHRQAWTSPLFQEGFLVEKNDRCVFCHAPLQQQFDAYKSSVDKKELLNEGVNCAACHIRDGKFFSARNESNRWHPVEKNELLSSPRFCAGCHQFNLDHSVNGQAEITDLNAQNTFKEWESYQQKGGAKTCQQCHMPDRSHEFKGAHSRELLKSSVLIKAKRTGSKILFTLQSENVGHHFPTGDVFRNLQLQISENGKDFRTIAYFGKKYEIEMDEKTGETRQVLKINTALKPFEISKVEFATREPVHYRLRYYYVSEKGYRTSQLSKNELVTDLAKGKTP